MAGYRRTAKAPLLSIALIVLLGAMAFVLLVNAVFPNPYLSAFPRPFSSSIWKGTDASAWPADKSRCAMLADLKYRVGIVGKTRVELVEMLGEPEGTYDNPPSTYWFLCPSFLDIYILNVRWRDGRAVSAEVWDT